MNALVQLFDSMLIQAFAFPFTLFRSIFLPSSIFVGPLPARHCSAAFGFVLTLVLTYIISNIYSPDHLESESNKWFGPTMLAGWIFALAAININAQQILISAFKKSTKPLQEQLHAILYSETILNLVMFPMIPTILSPAVEIEMSDEAAVYFLVLSAFSYVVTRNVIRYYYGIGTFSSWGVALLSLIVSFASKGIVTYLLFIWLKNVRG